MTGFTPAAAPSTGDGDAGDERRGDRLADDVDNLNNEVSGLGTRNAHKHTTQACANKKKSYYVSSMPVESTDDCERNKQRQYVRESDRDKTHRPEVTGTTCTGGAGAGPTGLDSDLARSSGDVDRSPVDAAADAAARFGTERACSSACDGGDGVDSADGDDCVAVAGCSSVGVDDVVRSTPVGCASARARAHRL